MSDALAISISLEVSVENTGAIAEAASPVSILIPTPLRSSTAGLGALKIAGGTVGEVLSSLVQIYPEVRGRLFNDQGEFYGWVHVYVNGEDVRFTGGLHTHLNAGDEVSIIPAVAGGEGDRPCTTEKEVLMAKPRDVSEEDFESEVLKATKPVLVDFWAPWCGPCRIVSPIVEELAEEYAGKVAFVKVNVDEAPKVAMKYRVMGIPTLMVFRDGKPVAQVVGAMPKKALKDRLLSQTAV